MNVLIEAEGVGVTYGRARPVDDVSLALSGGELLVVVGPNGAGKTTLMKILTGEVTPSAGRVTLDG
jgi:iron complex transport system ATP-binding protein